MANSNCFIRMGGDEGNYNMLERLYSRLQEIVQSSDAQMPFNPLTHGEMQEVVNVLQTWVLTEDGRSLLTDLLQQATSASQASIFKKGQESLNVMLTPVNPQAKGKK